MATVNAANRSSGLGIIAPLPTALISQNIKAGQKVSVRPAEPVFLFVPTHMGTPGKISGLNRNSPFTVSVSRPPAGVAVPREPGRWLRIELKKGVPAGRTDSVNIVTRAIVSGPVKAERKPFTLVSGAMRWY